MAYFGSGTEGLDWQAAWCFQCRHWRERPDDPMKLPESGCPIWDAHIIGELIDKKVAAALDMLVPSDSRECRMFESNVPVGFSVTEEFDALLGFTPGCEPAWHERLDRIRELVKLENR